MRLAAHVTHVPSGRHSVEDCIMAAQKPRVEAKAFPRIFGIKNVSCYDASDDFANVMTQLLDALEQSTDDTTARPDVVIYAHASPVQALKGSEVVNALSHSHPFLNEAEQIFEMDQNCCATLFWALDVAHKMIEAGDAHTIAVIAGDSYAALPLSDRYLAGCTVLGDAFTALLLDGKSGGSQIDKIALDSNPEFHNGHYGDADEIKGFNQAHVRLVDNVLSNLDYNKDADEPLLPHNINRFSWDQYCATTGTQSSKIWLNKLADVGHCGTIDGFLNLDTFFDDVTHDSAVLLGLGQGGFVGGCRLRKSTTEAEHAIG